MSAADDLAAALTAAKADMDALAGHFGSAWDAARVLTDDAGKALSDLAAVRAEYDAYRAAHPDAPPRSACVFGTSRPDLSGVAHVPGVRTYLQPDDTPTTVAADNGLARAFSQASDLVWLSIKAPAGGWLDALLADMRLRYPATRVLVTDQHEPYDGWYEKGGTAAWHAEQDAFEQILTRHPEAVGVVVLEGSRYDTPGYYQAMARPNQRPGLDSYNKGIQTPKAYVDPAEIHAPRLAAIRQAWGIGDDTPVYVGETGTGKTADDADGSGRLDWLRANHDFLAAECAVALNWNGAPSKCLLSASELAVFIG